jgi:hypothetical protein
MNTDKLLVRASTYVFVIGSIHGLDKNESAFYFFIVAAISIALLIAKPIAHYAVSYTHRILNQ